MKPNEIIGVQLAEAVGKYSESEANQTNVDLVRRIAVLFEQKGELDEALKWYTYTASLTNNTDPGVTRKALEIELRILDRSIAEFESWLDQYGNAESAQDVRRQLEDLKGRRIELSQPIAMSWASNGTDKPLQGRHGPW